MAKTFDNKDVSYNKGKSYNLSKGQLKSAGAAKAAKARTVSISSTKRATTGANKGKTLGPAGKPLTGSVKLPSGVTAVYKDGKRVTVSRAKPASARPTASGSSGSGMVVKRVVPPKGGGNKGKVGDKGKDKGTKPAVRFGKSYTTTTQTNPQAGRRPTSASTGGQVPSASRSYSNGAASAPADKRTPAEKTYDSVSKGVSGAVAKARGPWISEADKAKERAKRKLVKDTIAKATKGR